MARWLISACAALAAVLAACGGDDQPAPQQAAAQPAAAQPQEPSAQPAPAAEPEPAAAPAAQQAEPQQESPAEPEPPTVQEFADSVDAWLAGATMLRTYNSATTVAAGAETEVEAWFTFTPTYIYVATAPIELFGGAPAFPGIRLLWRGDEAWVGADNLDGWVPLAALAPGASAVNAGIVQLSALQRREAIYPSTATVSLAASDDGAPVAVLEYELSGADVETLTRDSTDPLSALNPLGVPLADLFGALLSDGRAAAALPAISSLSTRMIADADTGALLSVEMAAETAEGRLSAVTRLEAWNLDAEQIEPEPLASVSDLLLALFADSDPFGALDGLDAGLMVRSHAGYIDALEQLHLVQTVEGTVNGVERSARIEIKRDVPNGRFETSTSVDGSTEFGLLWTRDGVWISDMSEDWEPVSPALVGLSQYDGVDEFLAAQIQPDDAPLFPAPATDVEAGESGEFVLVISSEPDPAELEADIGQGRLLVLEAAGPLAAADAAVPQISRLRIELRFAGSARTPLSRTIEAAFRADGADYDIRSVTRIGASSGVEFSSP